MVGNEKLDTSLGHTSIIFRYYIISCRDIIFPVNPVHWRLKYVSNMIHPNQRTNVETVEHDLAFEFIPILFYVIMLDHNHHHVNILQELVEVRVLVRGNLVVIKKRIVALERPSEVTLLCLKHLECWRLAEVVYILLVGETIETHAAIVCDAVLLHNLVDAI